MRLHQQCQASQVFDLAKIDGNGAWRQNRGPRWDECSDGTVFVWKNFLSGTAPGFTKKIGHLVSHKGSNDVMQGHFFVLINYRWTKDPWRFQCKKEYTPRSQMVRMTNIASPLASGKTHSPNDVLRESQFASEHLTKLNPLVGCAGVRQASHAKRKAKRLILGSDVGVNFLIRHPQVPMCNLIVNCIFSHLFFQGTL